MFICIFAVSQNTFLLGAVTWRLGLGNVSLVFPLLIPDNQ